MFIHNLISDIRFNISFLFSFCDMRFANSVFPLPVSCTQCKMHSYFLLVFNTHQYYLIRIFNCFNCAKHSALILQINLMLPLNYHCVYRISKCETLLLCKTKKGKKKKKEEEKTAANISSGYYSFQSASL